MSEITIEIRLPGPDEPGYLRRQRSLMEALGRMDKARAGGEVQELLTAMDAVADEAARYLECPEGVDPREAAYDLSRNQFMEIMGALAGKAASPPKTR